MDLSDPTVSAPAPEPIATPPGPLVRTGFVLVTGLMSGLFLGAVLFGHGPVGRRVQRGFAEAAQPRSLAAGGSARALPPGHPPIGGFGISSDESSGCPYLDSIDGVGAASEESDEAQPLPRARPLQAPVRSLGNGPI